MQIKEIYCKDFTGYVDLVAVVASKLLKPKTSGGNYLEIIVQDATGKITCPLWDKFDETNKLVNEGQVVRVSGSKKIYIGANREGNIQVSKAVVVPYDGDLKNYKFVPTYDIPQDTLEYFKNIIYNLQEKYKKIAVAATGIDGYNDTRFNNFIKCVAGEKNHGAKQGGLFLHTVGLLKYIDFIEMNYVVFPFFKDIDIKNLIEIDRLRLEAILHDIEKTKEYEFETIIKRKNILVDHTIRGSIILEELNSEMGNPLNDEEIAVIQDALLCHHGHYGKYGEYDSFGHYKFKSLEATLLHFADMTDSQIMKYAENKI